VGSRPSPSINVTAATQGIYALKCGDRQVRQLAVSHGFLLSPRSSRKPPKLTPPTLLSYHIRSPFTSPGQIAAESAFKRLGEFIAPRGHCFINFLLQPWSEATWILSQVRWRRAPKIGKFLTQQSASDIPDSRFTVELLSCTLSAHSTLSIDLVT
jgi:hypothetical protein